MKLENILSEIMERVNEYKNESFSLKKERIQTIRDELSSLNVVLANINADLYEEALGAEFERKINVAKQAELILKEKRAKSSTEADKKALIECEPYFRREKEANAANNKAKLIRETVNGVLHSIASRLNIDQA